MHIPGIRISSTAMPSCKNHDCGVMPRFYNYLNLKEFV